MIRHFVLPSLGKMARTEIDYATESLSIAPGKTVTLQVEVDSKDTLTASDFECQPEGILTFQVTRLGGTSAQLSMTAAAPGSSALVWVKPKSVTPYFHVWIGPHIPHYGVSTSIDRLAMASNGTDLRKIFAIQRILQSDADCLISQTGGPYAGLAKPNGSKILNCGDVCLAVGDLLFGGNTYSNYFPYHQRITKTTGDLDWPDIKFAPGAAQKQQAAIDRELAKGAVRVGLVHSPDVGMLTNGSLQPEKGGGHFVLIVASDGNGKFLYLDPYPNFSSLTYAGGIHWNTGKVSSFLGEFSLVTDSQGTYFRGTGARKVIIAGPKL